MLIKSFLNYLGIQVVGIALPVAEPELIKIAIGRLEEKTTIKLYQELNTLADNIKQTIDKFQKIHSTIRYNRVHLTTTMKMLTRTILFSVFR